MAVCRLRCAGVLLLVFWLTADLTAFGFCGTEMSSASRSSAGISADHESNGDSTPPCCGAHHCFCCSSCAQVVKFELPFDAHSAFIAQLLQPPHADVSALNTSPPPRF